MGAPGTALRMLSALRSWFAARLTPCPAARLLPHDGEHRGLRSWKGFTVPGGQPACVLVGEACSPSGNSPLLKVD